MTSITLLNRSDHSVTIWYVPGASGRGWVIEAGDSLSLDTTQVALAMDFLEDFWPESIYVRPTPLPLSPERLRIERLRLLSIQNRLTGW